MFKRKALEKLKYRKEKKHQSILCFWRGQACWKIDNCLRICKAGVQVVYKSGFCQHNTGCP